MSHGDSPIPLRGGFLIVYKENTQPGALNREQTTGR